MCQVFIGEVDYAVAIVNDCGDSFETPVTSIVDETPTAARVSLQVL
jgi:hypothetical protein